MKLGKVQTQEDLFDHYCSGSGPCGDGPFEMKAAPVEMKNGKMKWLYCEETPVGTVFGISSEDPLRERRFWMLGNALACGADLEPEDLAFLDNDEQYIKNCRNAGLSPREFPGEFTSEEGTHPFELFELAPKSFKKVIFEFFDAIGLDLADYAEE